MKILLAADGSKYTEKAANYLAKHFDWFRDKPELHIAHIKRPIPQGMALVQAERILGRDAVDNYYAEEAHKALKHAERILTKHQIPYRSTYIVGGVPEEICQYASEIGADLIVMGSHGHSALGSMLLGSTTLKVLAMEKNIPVLIIR